MSGAELRIYLAICDDNPSDLKRMNDFVENWTSLRREPISVKSYENSGELLFDIEEGKGFDLILCDIEMPGISGIEIAKTIKKMLPYCITIFITSHIKYAIDAFEWNIFRFIPKNCLETRLDDALKDAVPIIKIQQEKYYIIENSNRIEKIAYRDILYMEKSKNYTIFYLKQNRTARVRASLKHVLSEIEQEGYEFIQRDLAVNLLHVMKLSKGMIFLADNICLPVSSSRQERIKNKISEFWERYL